MFVSAWEVIVTCMLLLCYYNRLLFSDCDTGETQVFDVRRVERQQRLGQRGRRVVVEGLSC